METVIEKHLKIIDFLDMFSNKTYFDDFTLLRVNADFSLRRDGTLLIMSEPIPIDEEYEKKSILQKAEEIVSGDRAEDYGDMRTSFDNIAKMWSVIVGKEVSARQVGLMMIALKLCRENNKHKEDNLVDCAGYAKCISML